jgi:hypothetical protein
MFKKSKDKTSIKGSTVSAFKKKVTQLKTLKVSKPKQKKESSVKTPTQKKTQTVARRPQKKQMDVATPKQISTRVMNGSEHAAKAKSVLAYAAGLTQSSRADKAKKEASLNARLREATRG